VARGGRRGCVRLIRVLARNLMSVIGFHLLDWEALPFGWFPSVGEAGTMREAEAEG